VNHRINLIIREHGWLLASDEINNGAVHAPPRRRRRRGRREARLLAVRAAGTAAGGGKRGAAWPGIGACQRKETTPARSQWELGWILLYILYIRAASRARNHGLRAHERKLEARKQDDVVVSTPLAVGGGASKEAPAAVHLLCLVHCKISAPLYVHACMFGPRISRVPLLDRALVRYPNEIQWLLDVVRTPIVVDV